MAGIEILIYSGLFLGLYFAVLIFSTFFENKNKIYKNLKRRKFPFVCLIVPGFNEEDNIERTLNSLINLDYPKEKLEIIVVDDGSQDNTFLKAKSFEQKDKRIKVFHKENGGKYTALNFGLKKTKAPFVGSVDADSYLLPDALNKIMEYFKAPEIKAVISTVKIDRVKNILEGVQYVEYLMAAFLRKVFSILDSVNVTPGPLSIFRKEVFQTLGPYRKAYHTEDLEIAYRLQKVNFKIAHAHDAIVYTKPCSTFKTLFRQRLRWRRGFILNIKDYHELLNFRKHGHLALLLSYSIVSSFLAVILASFTLWKIGDFLSQKISQVLLVGFDFSHLLSFNFNSFLFSFNVKPAFILGLISIATLFLYLFYSKKLTFDSKPVEKNIISYLLLYVFLNAIWWTSAIFSVLFKKEISWG